MQESPAPSPAALPAAPVATGLSLLVPMLVVVGLLLAVVLAGGSALRWLLFTEPGARWVLEHAPLVQARGFRGALMGQRWQADRLQVTWAGGKESVTIEGLDASGLRWTWRPHADAWLGLDAQDMTVRKLTVATGDPGPRPIPVPASVALPLQLTVAQARVQELQIDDLAPITDASALGLVLDAHAGAEHRVQQLALAWQGVLLQGQARIGNAAPLPLVAQATLRPAGGGDAPAWAAVLQAQGPLAQLQLTGTLRGVPQGGREAPELDLRAALRVLERWPLAGLELQTRALDLSALSLQAPQTRLSGQARLASTARNAPMTATVALDNALPGRWNEGRLPLRRIQADISGRLDQPDRLELPRFELDFADARQAAGRWSGSATWQGHELALKTMLQALAPQRLDGRAAAMLLSGPFEATLRGLPSPDPSATGAVPPPQVAWKLDLEGRLEAAPQAVRLAMEGQADDQRLTLRKVHASSGPARAEMQAVLQKAARGEWQLDTSGQLDAFDPVPWWPGGAGSAWRAGPHRLSAEWQLALRLPAGAERLPPVALAQRLAGNGKLRLHDSLLAGVPLAGDLTLAYAPGAANAGAVLQGELLLGGNQLLVQGRGDPAGAGTADRLRLDLQAENLVALAPLLRLSPDWAAWAPARGSANASLSLDGRWPALRSEGEARVQQLQAGSLTLARGTASWRVDTGGEQPLSLQAELSGAQLGGQRVEQLRGELRGTLSEHRIEVWGALPVSPPAALARLMDVPADRGTRALLKARGGWTAEPAGGGRWQAQVEQLVAGTWDGSAAASAPSAGWASARDLRAELSFGADGSLAELHVDAGRLQLADAVALRWQDVRVDLRGSHALLQLQAEIEPFALAPLLARMQPGMGWQGDLRLAARMDIRAGDRMDADVVFERHDGDLHLASTEGVQLLGLTELRVALAAHEGRWTFTPVFRGRSLGDISGSLLVQTAPERRWPHADAAVQGSVQARAADIGIWSAWVPPGWRLAGEVSAQAALGGRFAEPRYTGQVTGTGLAVRNLLQGVNVDEGQIAVRLDGDTATIERFTLRGGDGRLDVTGGASLGSAPQARLQFKAERFRVLGRVDRMVIASGNAELTLAREASRLDGRFTVDEGLFDTTRSDAPSLDDDVTVRRSGAAEEAGTEAAAPRPRRNFALNLELDLGQQLRVRGRGLDTGLGGSLKLTTPGGLLAVNGTITTLDGTYAAYGQKLDIERGILAFSGPPDNPRLDVLALRPNIDTRVGVLITGNLLTPRVRLFAEPELTDSEKLSWLVLGRAPDGLGRSDTALLQRAAVALLSGEGEAPTDALMKSLGIDELSLRQSDGDVRETVITLGKQLSRRWYLGYERGVNSTAGTWQLIYRIAQRFTLRAQSGLESSLDVIWVWRTQETPADAGVRKSTLLPP